MATNQPTMTYEIASELLGKRQQKTIRNNTVLRRDEVGSETVYVMRLWETDILTFFPDGSVELNSGGHQSATTKNRMGAIPWSLGGVFQHNYSWYVQVGAWDDKDAMRLPFVDRMTLHPNGTVTYPRHAEHYAGVREAKEKHGDRIVIEGDAEPAFSDYRKGGAQFMGGVISN